MANVKILTVFILLLHVVGVLFVHGALGQNVVVVHEPQNITAQNGTSVFLYCQTEPAYTGHFAWRFVGSTAAGKTIYLYPPYKAFPDNYPPNRFLQVGEHGLNITSLQWQDGGTYDCAYYDGDVHGFSDIVVVGMHVLNKQHMCLLLHCCTCLCFHVVIVIRFD